MYRSTWRRLIRERNEYGIGLKLFDFSGKSVLGVTSASKSTKICLIFYHLSLTFYDHVWQYLALADPGGRKNVIGRSFGGLQLKP